MKKFLTLGLAMTMLAGALTGCGGSDTQAEENTAGGAITVVSREDGSGTRGAFVELFGIEEHSCYDDDGGRKYCGDRICFLRFSG